LVEGEIFSVVRHPVYSGFRRREQNGAGIDKIASPLSCAPTSERFKQCLDARTFPKERSMSRTCAARSLKAKSAAFSERRIRIIQRAPSIITFRVFLIDRSGRVRNIHSSGTLDVRLVLTDVQTLLMEPRY
jgi:hypothetical protein